MLQILKTVYVPEEVLDELDEQAKPTKTATAEAKVSSFRKTL